MQIILLIRYNIFIFAVPNHAENDMNYHKRHIKINFKLLKS